MPIRIDHRLVRFFEPEEHPCYSVESVFIIWHLISSVLNRLVQRPTVVRYGERVHRRVLAGNFEPFVRALEVWIFGMKHSTRIGYSLREAVREVLGRDDPVLRYYMRFLGMYMTSEDARLFRKFLPSADRGFAYPLFKIVFTGEYGGKHPFEFQVEIATYCPALYVTSSRREVCVDVGYLSRLGENLLVACADLTSDEHTANLLDAIVSEAEVEGFEVSFSELAWGLEYRLDIRWCLVAVQKQNLYGTYPYYEYYMWIVRAMYPSTEAEPIILLRRRRYAEAERLFVDVEKTIRPVGRVGHSKIALSDATRRVLEEVAQVIAKFAQRRQEQILKSPILGF